MHTQYTFKMQRNAFLTTLQNDIVLKASDERKQYFEQIGAGRKAFKSWWNKLWFRATFGILLPFIMLTMDFYLPISNGVKLLLHKKKILFTKRLFIGLDQRLFAISKRANIQKEGDVWLRFMYDKYILPEPKSTISVYDLVTFGEIFISSFQAFLIHMETICCFGYDKYFLSYKAYEWCLTDFALRHVPEDVELLHSYICDRNAILIDKLPHNNKSLIQHGTMHFGNLNTNNPYKEFCKDRGFYIWNSLYKSSPLTVYCYTADDEWALSNSVIANHPTFVHIGYGFKPTFKPNKKSILIVANYYLFAKQEDFILSQLQNLDIIVFLKNHPTIDNSLYDEMRKKYHFRFIEGTNTELPNVELLISYDSTLAYEYASIGTKVLYYGRFEIDNIKAIVKSSLNLAKLQ